MSEDATGQASEVLLATWNEGKVRWMAEGLASLPLPLRPLAPGEIADVEESGASCEENAWLKVDAVPQRPGLIVVAEDSGLFVDALSGHPGTHTARWAPGSDDDRARRLLERLAEVPDAPREAHFLSAVAIRFPDGRERTVRGVLEGRIRRAPGSPGSGYGGIFERPDGSLLAEAAGIGPHRTRALAAATRAILRWLGRETVGEAGAPR